MKPLQIEKLSGPGAAKNGIEIEKIHGEPVECHVCGKVGSPRYLIHLAHLCQHFVGLCGSCLRKLAKEISMTFRFR